MGLLDDAIREHLELKRLRGADPGAVAREEQDALGPVRHEGETDQGGEESRGERPQDTGGSVFPNSESDRASDLSTAGQETTEINMEAELAAEADSADAQQATPPTRAATVTHSAHMPASTEESLEWEVPGDSSEEPATGAGADEEAAPRAEDDERVEDVLEETPDFLRDTPDQERLWFEQRPPRDFDFNE